MEEALKEIFGEGKDLTVLQMVLRSIVIFVVCLLLIRLSGRRSFGMRMPLDSVVTILLGAILSRAVVGASPFLGTVAAATALAVLHRVCGWLSFHSSGFGLLIKGREKVIYKDGKMDEENMKKCLISEKDLIESIRTNSNLNSFEKIEIIFMERDGQISIVKKSD